ncbi:enoyl-CoA-hydratase DpgB [Amycolatopsis sp. cmx-11-12]|uniref:enoyl-CoA-hydratase DpgB n=1 Tax=Amycolatopsis sp. cmx-11-12 TaxID=2785795 RepID=UPI0039175F5C
MTLGTDTGLVLEVNSDVSLSPELVATMNRFCADVEDVGTGQVAVLRVGATGQPGTGMPWPGDVNVHLVGKWEQAVRRFERLGAASIAVAAGDCGGPALDLLLACDYRIGVRDLRLTVPVGPGGSWPGMSFYRLANQLGVARSRALVLFEQSFSAQRAFDVGLVDELVDDRDAAAEAVKARSAAFGDQAGVDVEVRRRLLLDAATMSFEDALGAHLAACDRALRHARKG